MHDEEWHAEREEWYLSQLVSCMSDSSRVYWKGEIYSKDENRTYSFHVEGATKERAMQELLNVYGKGSSAHFKDRWIVRSMEKCK